jgi:hypothetical protein
METLAVIADRFGSDRSDVQGAAQSSIAERGSGQAIRRAGPKPCYGSVNDHVARTQEPPARRGDMLQVRGGQRLRRCAMSDHDHWQLDGSAPELYQRYLVPAMTSIWAADLH